MTPVDSLAAARVRRGLTVPILAVAAGVAQHDLQAAERGDAGALTVSEATRVGLVLGIDAGRVLEVPPPAADERRRVLQAPRRQEQAQPGAWRRFARRAGVHDDAWPGGEAA